MLLEALSKLGLSLEKNADRISTRMGVKPLGWPPGDQPGSLIYRLPVDPAERASLFAKEQRIRVSEGEVAVLIKDGVLRGVLEAGTYRTEKARLIGDVDVIWIKTGARQIRWGVGHVLATDGVEVGASGTVSVAVQDGMVFNREVVQGALTLSDTDLQRTLMPGVQAVVRTILAQHEATALMSERDRFIEAVRTALGEEVGTLGLTIRGFEVSDFNLPAEFRQALASEAMATARGRGQSVEARLAAERQMLEVQTEAAALLMKGDARAKVFAHLRAQGIDPMSLEAMDVLKAYAATPSGGLLGADAAKAGLIGSLAAAAMSASEAAAMTRQPAEIVHRLQSGAAERPPVEVGAGTGGGAAQPAAGASDGGDDLAALQRQLDGLTERLANGELSEALYLKLADRLEKRIAALGGE
jgi:flotillin